MSDNVQTLQPSLMCRNTACPSRHSCYRYRARPALVQTYVPYEPDPGSDKCDQFWPLATPGMELRTSERADEENGAPHFDF